ncbi:MAG: Unknown protein [uncultured Sulfurovum sp.]|uniref:Uncharacterized protein n=1 Tax=uncultured Sulfurovum sp. TaxID=269237 RepID=A0A6S6TX17_9BACT|nr:MAG: Unknown protein [uncultured Sulfurovum sp.]
MLRDIKIQNIGLFKKGLFAFALFISQVNAGFNFGDCSGSGTFEQQIVHYAGDYENTTTVGHIPQGIEGLRIELISDKDVDIRLYGTNDDKIVHWPYGIHNQKDLATKPYQDINITYSGYNGFNGEKGHEYIEIGEPTNTTMTMKAFGYHAGYATVNYSWTGKVGCTSSNEGNGTFQQEILHQATNLVGTIPPNIQNLEINLTSDKDLDIQLYAKDGTAIVSWQPTGLLSGPTEQNILYHDMNITWSGYNGTGVQTGHEYIKITGNTTEMLVMKVYGYEAGFADVTYKWGDTNDTDNQGPQKPTLNFVPPAQTQNSTESIELSGEAGTKVFVNAVYIDTINASGILTLTLDTSGEDGIKTFTILLEDDAGHQSEPLILAINKQSDPKYALSYKGLTFYYQDLVTENYGLTQLNNNTFNALSDLQKEQIANKLLTTLFYAYPYTELKEKIAAGNFVASVRDGLLVDTTDTAWLETHIVDDDIYQQSSWNEQEAVNILTRFYAMPSLDHYFLRNWMAYILTQTIMFSPAYELESTHTPNIATVYNRLVVMLGEESGMRYMSYVHMMSEDNWRRFRSPEDNGREMLEIFALDMNDSHVPIAGKALQNWKLDTDGNTLVVGLNQNTDPLSLFGTTIYNGDDFYRELVKSDLFTYGVTQRLVSFFFPQTSMTKQSEITASIVASNPETWQDILLQIVFSEEYLLHTTRSKSAEELFFSSARKTYFKHRRGTFHEFKDRLEDMHQASMKYKLGKIKRVPLDTLSFANYHKYIRERIFLRQSDPSKETDYNSWSRHGWGEAFVSNEHFDFDENDEEASLVSLIHYIFHSILSRPANSDELTLFKNHMLYEDNGENILRYNFDIVRTYSDAEQQLSQREKFKRNVTIIVLDYISRLTETYTLNEVQ